MLDIADILRLKQGLPPLMPWDKAREKSTAILSQIPRARRAIRNEPRPCRLPIIASDDAAAAILEAAGHDPAPAVLCAVVAWLEGRLATLEDALSGRVFLPLESVAILEAAALAFVRYAVAEHERAEAEELGRAVREAAAQRGTTPADLLAALSPPAAGADADY